MKTNLLWRLWTSPVLQRSAGLLSLGLVILMFMVDLLVPLGYSYALLNILAIVFACFSREPLWIKTATLLSVASTALVPLLTTIPAGIPASLVVFNRAVSIAVCLLAGFTALQVLTLASKARDAAAHLRQSSELLEIASRLGKLGGWYVDLATQKISWSEEVARIHGHAPGHAPSFDEGFSYYPPEYRQQLLREFNLCATQGKSFDLDLQIITVTGQRRWVRAVGQAVRNSRQQIIGIQGAFQDIQTEMNSRLEIIRSAERLAATMESVTDAILTMDRQWRFTYLNHHAETLLRRRREDLVGKVFWNEFPDAAGSVFEDQYLRCMNERVTVRFEAHIDPLEMLCEINAYPSEEGISVYFRNITEQRRFSDHLQQLQKLEALGQLTGGVAHDFNNLLTVILGNAELLHEQLRDKPELEQLADMISGAAQRAADMTQRLLAFARKQALEPAPADLNRLVTGLEPLVRRTLGAAIEIEVIKAGQLWMTLVDQGQLENCLLNLAINARDAMPGGGKLTIETSNTQLDAAYAAQHLDLEPGQYVMLAVTDTGQGIPPALMKKVFDPFFTTKEAGKGTGLGLAMVYGFVKQSSGHITIASEVGCGTTIRIYLPRLSRAPPGPATAPASAIAQQGSGERILLVEDDALVQQYTHDLLVELGYRVLVANNGQAALDLLRDNTDVDLLLTDIMMPGGMNGDQLARHAQRLRPQLPVLYTSGYAENAIVHHGRIDPGVLLLGKPYRRRELAAKLRQALAGGPRDPQQKEPPQGGGQESRDGA